MGPLFTYIISDQFIRTAAADETFGVLDPALGAAIIADVKATDMKDVILRNTDIDTLQDNPFLMETRVLTDAMGLSGTDDDDAIHAIRVNLAGDIQTYAGDDTVFIKGGSIVRGDVDLGRGDDRLIMSSGRIEGDVVGEYSSGYGDDTMVLSGGARIDSILSTGVGADDIDLSNIASVGRIDAGDGNDVFALSGKASVDSRVDLGDGDDHATLTAPGVANIDGGDGHDTLQARGGKVNYDDGSDRDGTISWTDGGTTRFEDFEVVTCFTPGTLIVTAAGKRPIEDLRPGARVLTLDHGLQPVRWIGRTTVSARGKLPRSELIRAH